MLFFQSVVPTFQYSKFLSSAVPHLIRNDPYSCLVHFSAQDHTSEFPEGCVTTLPGLVIWKSLCCLIVKGSPGYRRKSGHLENLPDRTSAIF
jgi:hypothetical protein